MSLPEVVFLVFEWELFLGCFRDRDAAQRLVDARIKGGNPQSAIVIATYHKQEQNNVVEH